MPVKGYRQNLAGDNRQDIAMKPPEHSARDLLAANLARLMEEHPNLGSPARVAKVARWPAGRKKGLLVSERQIRYAVDRREDTVPPTPSPTLDFIIAMANAFNVPAWQLILDDQQLRRWMVGKLFTTADGVPDKEVEKHLPMPPKSKGQRAKKRKAGAAGGDDPGDRRE